MTATLTRPATAPAPPLVRRRAIQENTTEYDRRVVGHFDEALAPHETKQELP